MLNHPHLPGPARAGLPLWLAALLILSAAHVSAQTAPATPAAAVASSAVASATISPTATTEQTITTLYLFVHCLGSWDHDGVRNEYTAKWRALLTAEGPKPDTAVCFLTSGPEASATVELAKQLFGPRCIVDPDDKSPATKALLADDLTASFNQRGMISEWTPYEMWTSTNARRWTEGLKAELRRRHLTYDPARLRLVALGQQWGGCLAKYSAFMGRYLGNTRPAEIRPDLSPYAGYPLKAIFRQSFTLDRHVQLFLFETADGRPMAQFFDGLRGVFEPPHVALVPLASAQVDLISVPPNATQQAQPVANPIATEKIMVDVGDGCRPVLTTVIGKNLTYDAFRAALTNSAIVPFARKFDSKTRYLPEACSDLFCPKPPSTARPALP
ncbi:hypothetical protein LBMAG56_25250 [Verrucomicrobiota bacterium]|nr:hypothetical protein LBMAG56_25250 [Verrucomicrobiota bacterium]